MADLVNTEPILDMQRKLYRWSRNEPDNVFGDLFNLVCDRRTLALAWHLLSRNKGSRTAGVDGLTRRKVEECPGGAAGFLESIREELRSGTYQPQNVRQKLIPKPGKPGKFRPLGIPTLRDRLVQMALKLILEPIFEADFAPTSYGFRRGRSAHDALAMLVQQLKPTCTGDSPMRYAIEGDIKGCFDAIDHHLLMERVRRRIGDKKVLRLVLAFLKAGILAEGELRHPVTGTPQGGIISPLLANVYLTALDERYYRWTFTPYEPPTRILARRRLDRKKGKPTFFIVRYADDFVILTDGDQAAAEAERESLATFLREELRMELSLEKTLVTKVEKGFTFLGYRVVVEPARNTGKPVGKLRIPQEKQQLFRDKIKGITARTSLNLNLETLLRRINPMTRGWRNYYRYATGASDVFSTLDSWVWWRVTRWLWKKHRRVAKRKIRRQYACRLRPTRWTWGEGETLLKPMIDGGTSRFPFRGTKISNGWNDQEDRFTSKEADRHSTVLSTMEETLR